MDTRDITCNNKALQPTIETCQNFARLAEVAASQGVASESVFFMTGHIRSLLEDLSDAYEGEHAAELAALVEYAANADSAANFAADGDNSHAPMLSLLVNKLNALSEKLGHSCAVCADMGVLV